MAERVSIAEIATKLNLDTTTVRRLIARESEELGLTVFVEKGNKRSLSKDDADKLIASYEARRGKITDLAVTNEKYDRFGYFYIIQLIPEILPNRIKIGFADNVEQRLREHQTAAPTAKLVKTWPCKRSWDYAAMDSITRQDCKLVLNEVYEGEVDKFIERGNDFFSRMPNPDNERELSEFSPLYIPPGERE
jgi:hypothetical protein